MFKNFSRLFSAGFFLQTRSCLPLLITVSILFSSVTTSLFRDQSSEKLLTFNDVPIILVMCFHGFRVNNSLVYHNRGGIAVSCRI